MPPSVEQDFLEFRRTGNTGSLARVFDALAPELLLLAAHLSEDAARAEDLVQDTFLQAIESAGQYKGHARLRSWLAGILVHWAKKARRREARQYDPGRLDGVPSVDPAAEAEARELADSLSRTLQSLPMPYRQVLNLRLVHGLSAVEISRSLERPPATVHTQLRRGLELLRRSLPKGLTLPGILLLQGHGLAIARRVVLERAASVAGILTTGFRSLPASRWLLPYVAVGLLGLGAMATGLGVLTPDRTAPSTRLDQQATTFAEEPLTLIGVRKQRQTLVRQPWVSEEEGGRLRVPHLAGLVLDPEGRPLPGLLVAHVGVDPNMASGRSNANGRFQLDLSTGVEPHSARLAVADPGMATLGNFWRAAEGEQVVVATRSRSLEGWVRDTYGNPLEGANARVSFSIRGLHSFPLPSDESTATIRVRATTDATGYFRLVAIPDVPGLYLSVKALSYAPESRLLSTGPLPAVEIPMKPAQHPGQPVIRGIVLSAEGSPVSGAHVSLGAMNSAVTDAAGQFALTVHPAGPPWIYVGQSDREQLARCELMAAAIGHLPAVLRGFGLRFLENDDFDYVQLQLGPSPSILSGRILDEEGAPWPDLHLWAELADPTRNGVGSRTAQDVAGGRLGQTRTDARGAFVMTGLMKVGYRLRILDPETTVELLTDRVYGGQQGLELVLSRVDVRPPVSGRVEDQRGSPLAGVAVAPALPGTEQRPEPGRPVFTDSEGRYTLAGMPRSPRLLTFRCPGYGSETINLDSDDRSIATVVLKSVARVRLSPSGDHRPVQLRAEDAEGRELIIRSLSLGGGQHMARMLPLPTEQPLPVCQLPVTARALVVEFENGSTQRIPVDLIPGELRILNF